MKRIVTLLLASSLILSTACTKKIVETSSTETSTSATVSSETSESTTETEASVPPAPIDVSSLNIDSQDNIKIIIDSALNNFPKIGQTVNEVMESISADTKNSDCTWSIQGDNQYTSFIYPDSDVNPYLRSIDYIDYTVDMSGDTPTFKEVTSTDIVMCEIHFTCQSVENMTLMYDWVKQYLSQKFPNATVNEDLAETGNVLKFTDKVDTNYWIAVVETTSKQVEIVNGVRGSDNYEVIVKLSKNISEVK